MEREIRFGTPERELRMGTVERDGKGMKIVNKQRLFDTPAIKHKTFF